MKEKLFVLFTFLPWLLLSQQEIDFTIEYLPNSEYQISIIQNSEYTLVDKSEDTEPSEPETSSSSTRLRYKTKTKSIQENGIPITVELLDSIGESFDKGTKFYGRSKGLKVEIDSIASSKLNDTQNELILDAVQSMLNQVEYPSQKVKIGENFNHNYIMDISSGIIPIKIDVESKYTLVEINDGVGLFNIDRNYKLDSNNNGFNIQLSGFGNGQLTYDAEKKFYLSSVFSFELKMIMKMDDIEMEVDTKSISEYTAEILKIRNE